MAETTYNPEHLNMQKTSTTGVAPLFSPAVNRYVLDRAKEQLYFSQFGQQITVPRGKGKTITFDRMEPLTVSTAALVEGVTPQGDNLAITRITAIPTQHGRYVTTTDEFDFYKHDPSPEALKLGELFAENAAGTYDKLTLNVLKAGTNVQYAGGAATMAAIASTGKFGVAEVKKAVRTLTKNKAKRFGDSFVCVIDADMAYDLMNESVNGGWVDVSKYKNPEKIYSGEIGKLYGVRFVVTTQNLIEQEAAEASGSNAAKLELHCAYFFGQDAYGTTGEKGNIETIWKNKGSGGTADPLEQRSTAGWKGHHCAKILTEGWMVRAICAVSE